MIVYRRAKSAVRTVVKDWRRQRLLEARANRSSAEPEFADLLEARGDWLFENLPHEAAEYVYHLHSKDAQKRLARQLGLSVAEEYITHVPLAEALAFMESTYLDHFVLKPNNGKSAAGVFCLVREGAGYRELKSGKLRTSARLVELAAESYGQLGRPDDWLVEELLLSPHEASQPADDLKFFCFRDRVEMIFQKGEVTDGKRRKQAVRFYDRDGVPVNTGLRPEAVSDLLKLPSNIGEMVAIAERASGRITTPFMRVDLYDTHRGVVLGEFTPGPGRMYQLNEEWKERFTRLWHESARALEAGLLSGEIQPLLPDDPQRHRELEPA
ncbi:MAG TPA: ATP-grasp fold amidoligase family protein [Trueperaceae bacterium]|nr:ATP-grasp fold amidoligase family protein [Trueperaceae bacterium]